MKEVAGLNWLRGLAALLVVISHARPFFYVNYSEYEGSRTPFVQSFYLLSGLGTTSVVVFFVLSGYLVAGSVERSWKLGKWKVQNYLIARFCRLWTVLVPCLVLTFLLDHIGLVLSGSGFYSGDLFNELSSGPSGHADWSVTTLLGNIAFLQTISVSVYGSNGPLWSIANEFWYYILFPALFLCVNRPTDWLRYAILVGAITILIGWDITKLFPIWLAGYGAWFFRTSSLSVRLQNQRTLAVVIVASLILGILGIRIAGVQHSIGGYYVAAVLTMLAVPALHHPIYDVGATFSGWLSRISFSLYLSHFPVLALVYSLNGGRRASTFLDGIPLLITGLLASLAAALAVWWLFERHTPAVRTWAVGLFRK